MPLSNNICHPSSDVQPHNFRPAAIKYILSEIIYNPYNSATPADILVDIFNPYIIQSIS